MLKVFLYLMCTLSLILLSLHLLALSTTPAAFQSILWFVFMQWTAFAFLTAPVLTALLCSVILVFNGLSVSPTYTSSHCAQGIWYTTPLFTCFCGPFTLVSRLLNVLLCWNTGCTPTFLQIFPSLSEVPFTYGSTHKVFLTVSSPRCVSSCSSLTKPVMGETLYWLTSVSCCARSSKEGSSCYQLSMPIIFHETYAYIWWDIYIEELLPSTSDSQSLDPCVYNHP